MPSIGSITKTIRINAEDLAVIEELMAREGLSWSGAIHKIISDRAGTPIGLPYGIEMEYLDDLATMVGFGCESVGEIIRMVDDGLNDGSLLLANGKIVGTPVINIDGFLEACHDAGADPQKVLDKATKGIGR